MMKTHRIIARKSMTYATRHLVAGEEYEFPYEHALALVAMEKAYFADKVPRSAAKLEQLEPAAESEPDPQPAPISEEDQLRLEATRRGIDVDGRWGRARLRHEIDQAKR